MDRPLIRSHSPALGPVGREVGAGAEVVEGAGPGAAPAACLRPMPLHWSTVWRTLGFLHLGQ